MAFAYLGSWLPTFSSGTGPVGPEQSKQLSEEQLNELHLQWANMQASHQQQAESLLGKLVAENDELKARLAVTDRELKDVKAGRKEDEELLEAARNEVERLGGGNASDSAEVHFAALAVAILDFELDLFSPEVFHHPADAGRYAAEALHRQLRKSLLRLPAFERDKTWQFMVYIFWTRTTEFVESLSSHGLITSVAELDDFINGFNRAHPLFLLIVGNTASEMTLQRQRALATIFARNPLCQRLVIGRWGFDLPLAETLCPSRGADKVTFPDKILFVEPYHGFYLLPQLRRREPQIIEMDGVLRRHQLKAGGARKGNRVEVDYTKPLWKQNPPICLDFYLASTRCTDERCKFSHSYKIPREVLEALRFELSRTPCPLLLVGYTCLDQDACFFAHTCPKRELCPRTGCPFTAPGMHPRVVPQPPPAPVQHHWTTNRTAQQASVPSPRQQPTSSAPRFANPSPTKPPSTRSALVRLLAASPKIPPSDRGASGQNFSPKPTSIPHPPSPSKPTSASPLRTAKSHSAAASPKAAKKHPIQLGSPFGHPLSLADEAEVEAAKHGQLAPSAEAGEATLMSLTDEELAEMLAKARNEEKEYEVGIKEDPFVAVENLLASSQEVFNSLFQKNQDLSEELNQIKFDRALKAKNTATAAINRKNAEKKQELDELNEKIKQATALAPPRPMLPAPRPMQPIILTPIDASTAPFDETLICTGWLGGNKMGDRLAWEIELDTREHDIDVDDGGSSETIKPFFTTYVFCNKKALADNLIKHEVVDSPSVFDDFLTGFASLGNNQVIDSGEKPIEPYFSYLLLSMGPTPALKRIYLAGVNVDNLREACPQLKPSAAAFYLKTGPKIVLVNHRENDEQRDVLLTSGWRVTVFCRYFSSQHGLGGDLGWKFRPDTPPIGPGDANLEDGDNENRYAAVNAGPAIGASSGAGWTSKTIRK
ncbi:hypothetical protein JCM11641_000258 [Rhodosporidiobolus odoratus]